MRTLLMEQEAQTIFANYHGVFAEVVYGAWDKWNTFHLPHLPLAPEFRSRCVANVITATIEFDLRMRLGADESLILSELSRTEPRFWARWKHQPAVIFVKKLKVSRLTGNWIISNVKTDHAEAWNGQMDLPGMTDTRVTLGYHLSPSNDQLLGVHVVLLQGSFQHWAYEIRPDGSTIGGMPIQPTLPLGDALLRVKGESTKEEAEGDE